MKQNKYMGYTVGALVVVLAGIFFVLQFNLTNIDEAQQRGIAPTQTVTTNEQPQTQNNKLVGESRPAFNPRVRSKVLDKLVADDEEVRRSAFNALTKEISKMKIGVYLAYGKDLLPYLSYGLSDPKDEFSQYSSAMIYHLSFAVALKNKLGGLGNVDVEQQQIISKMPNLIDYAPLREALIYALQNNSVADVRSMSAQSLALGYTVDAETEQLLVTQLGVEKNSGKARHGILTALLVMANSLETTEFQLPETMRAVVKHLNDPDLGVSLAATNIVSLLQPDYALSALVTYASTTTHPMQFDHYLYAVEAYGQKAQGYVPQLERLLQVSEDAKRKNRIRVTIDKISVKPEKDS